MTPRSVPPAATLLGQELREVSARSVVPSAAVNVVPSSGIVMASVAAFATATCTRVKWLVYVTFSTVMVVVDAGFVTGLTSRSTPDSFPVRYPATYSAPAVTAKPPTPIPTSTTPIARTTDTSSRPRARSFGEAASSSANAMPTTNAIAGGTNHRNTPPGPSAKNVTTRL